VESQVKPDISPQEARNISPERILMLTDAVVAIIMTILVLDLEIPGASEGKPLSEGLADLLPIFTTFVISFLLVGMYWVWHRGFFAQVRYADYRLAWLNLLFLLPLSAVPFAASTLGSHPDDATALQLYGAILVAVTVMRSVLNWYLHRHPWMLWQVPSTKARRLSAIAAAAPLVVYILAMAVATPAPVLSTFLYLAVPLIYAAVVLFLKSDARTSSAAQDIS
jgi:uncharacterized membrane protein